MNAQATTDSREDPQIVVNGLHALVAVEAARQHGLPLPIRVSYDAVRHHAKRDVTLTLAHGAQVHTWAAYLHEEPRTIHVGGMNVTTGARQHRRHQRGGHRGRLAGVMSAGERSGHHGVPDLTPNTAAFGAACEATNPHSYGMCTRLAGHTGRHAAGTGREIVAVWS